MKDFRTFYIPLVLVPLALFVLTLWTFYGTWEEDSLPGLAMVFAGLGFWYGVKDRKRLLAVEDDEPARNALGDIIIYSYLKGLVWLGVGLLISAIFSKTLWPPALGLVIGFVIARKQIAPKKSEKTDGFVHVRGRYLKTFQEVLTLVKRSIAPDEPTLTWGGALTPEKSATTHFCVVGATGSGKTLTMRLLMKEVLSKVGRVPDTRALIYDAKGNMPSVLASMNLTAKVRLIKPFDKRGCAWDIASDVTDLAPAQTVASIIFPKNEHDHQPYFTEASQQILAYLMLTLHDRAPGKWTLRDLVLACRSNHLEPILKQRSASWNAIAKHFEAREVSSLYTTLTAKCGQMESVAASWFHAKDRISLSAWQSEGSILVLDRGIVFEDAVKPINQVIVRRLSQLLLSQSESPTRRTWVFLDEFQGAGQLEGLDKLLTEGRSKGACVFLGFQDLGALKKAYGEHLPGTLTSNCSHRAFLRTTDPTTKEWAEKCLGNQERDEFRQTSSKGGGAGGWNWNKGTNQERVTRPIVMGDTFNDIPLANEKDGLCGFYDAPTYGAWSYTYPWPHLMDSISGSGPKVPDFIPQEVSQEVPPWTCEDLERLDLLFLRDTAEKEQRTAQTDSPKKASIWDIQRFKPPKDDATN